MHSRPILRILLLCAVFCALEPLFDMDGSVPEWLLGAAGAVLSLWGTLAFARAAHLRFALPCRALLEGWRIPGYAVSGTLEVWRALARQLFTSRGADSYLALTPYRDNEETPLGAGRRALEVTYATCTPNFVILGISADDEEMLFHQVLKGPIVRMAQNLGAGAESHSA